MDVCVECPNGNFFLPRAGRDCGEDVGAPGEQFSGRRNLRTDAGGCESELSDPYDDEIIGITENDEALPVAYPVPTPGIIHINEKIISDDIEGIILFDRSGRVVMNCRPSRSIDLSGFENGVYYMVLKGKAQIQPAVKIIIME